MAMLIVLSLFSPVLFVLTVFAVQTLPFGWMQRWEDAAAARPGRWTLIQVVSGIVASAVMYGLFDLWLQLADRFQNDDRLLESLFRSALPVLTPAAAISLAFLPLFAGRPVQKRVRLGTALFLDACLVAGLVMLPYHPLSEEPSASVVIYGCSLVISLVLATGLAMIPPKGR